MSKLDELRKERGYVKPSAPFKSIAAEEETKLFQKRMDERKAERDKRKADLNAEKDAQAKKDAALKEQDRLDKINAVRDAARGNMSEKKIEVITNKTHEDSLKNAGTKQQDVNLINDKDPYATIKDAENESIMRLDRKKEDYRHYASNRGVQIKQKQDANKAAGLSATDFIGSVAPVNKNLDSELSKIKEFADANKDKDGIISQAAKGYVEQNLQNLIANEYTRLQYGLPNEVEKVEAFLKENPSIDPATEIKRGFFGSLFHGAGTTISQLMGGVKEGKRNIAGYTAAAAGTAGIVGQLGPQALLPEEIITVPASALAGATFGMAKGVFDAMSRVEAGMAYRDMLQQGISPSVAATAASITGPLNGLIEVAEVSTMVFGKIPGKGIDLVKDKANKVLTKKLTDILTAYGASVGTQVVEELVQENASMAIQEVSKAIDDPDGTKLARLSAKDFFATQALIAKETFFATALLSGVGVANQARITKRTELYAKETVPNMVAAVESDPTSLTEANANELIEIKAIINSPDFKNNSSEEVNEINAQTSVRIDGVIANNQAEAKLNNDNINYKPANVEDVEKQFTAKDFTTSDLDVTFNPSLSDLAIESYKEADQYGVLDTVKTMLDEGKPKADIAKAIRKKLPSKKRSTQDVYTMINRVEVVTNEVKAQAYYNAMVNTNIASKNKTSQNEDMSVTKVSSEIETKKVDTNELNVNESYAIENLEPQPTTYAYENEKGDLYVLNNAKFLDPDKTEVKTIKAADGVSAKAAVVIENAKNDIGNAIDVAIAIKKGANDEGESKVLKDAKSLAKLDDSVFNQVVAKLIPMDKAIAIAENVSSKEAQMQVAAELSSMIAAGKKITTKTFNKMLQLANETDSAFSVKEKAELLTYAETQIEKRESLKDIRAQLKTVIESANDEQTKVGALTTKYAKKLKVNNSKEIMNQYLEEVIALKKEGLSKSSNIPSKYLDMDPINVNQSSEFDETIAIAKLSPVFNGVEIEIMTEKSVRYWTKEELNEAGYNNLEAGNYEITGYQVSQIGESQRIVLNSGASQDTIAEELIHVFQERVAEIDPVLAFDIAEWEAEVIKEAENINLEIPKGRELFAKAMVFSEMGWSNQEPMLARIFSVPDDIINRVSELIGDNLFDALKGANNVTTTKLLGAFDKYSETRINNLLTQGKGLNIVIFKNDGTVISDQKSVAKAFKEILNGSTEYSYNKGMVNRTLVYLKSDPMAIRNILNDENYQLKFDNDYWSMYSDVRGELTKEKIIKRLKEYGLARVNSKFPSRELAKFNSAEEAYENIYYHGSPNGSINALRPSISLNLKDEDMGGGYGDKYFAISLSKSKDKASNFTSNARYGSVYTVLLKKGANVISMPEIQDSIELDDIIVDLWEKQVDAVKIGDWSNPSSEQEIAIINPRAITVKRSESFPVYQKKKFENMPFDEFKAIYDEGIKTNEERIAKFSDEPLTSYQIKPANFTTEEFRQWFGDSKVAFTNENAEGLMLQNNKLIVSQYQHLDKDSTFDYYDFTGEEATMRETLVTLIGEEAADTLLTKGVYQGKFSLPVVMYHGTPIGGYESFDFAKTNPYGLYGGGFYFTDSESIAETYTKADRSASNKNRKITINGEKIEIIGSSSIYVGNGFSKVFQDLAEVIVTEKIDFMLRSPLYYFDQYVTVTKTDIEKFLSKEMTSEDVAYETIKDAIYSQDTNAKALYDFYLLKQSHKNLENRYESTINEEQEDGRYLAVYSVNDIRNIIDAIINYDFDDDTVRIAKATLGMEDDISKETVYKVNLSIQNPIDADAAMSESKLKGFIDFILDRNSSDLDTNEMIEHFKNYVVKYPRFVDKGIDVHSLTSIMNFINMKHGPGFIEDVPEALQSIGYDGLTHMGGYVNGGRKHRVYIAWNPTQIKSIENTGVYSKTNANINYQIKKQIVASSEKSLAVVPQYTPDEIIQELKSDDIFDIRKYDNEDGKKAILSNLDEMTFLLKPADTKSKEFKRWFNGSKVVDKNGEPLVVYHGTGAEFEAFDSSKGGSYSNARSAKLGFFFTNSKDMADTYKNGKYNYKPVEDFLNSLTDDELIQFGERIGDVDIDLDDVFNRQGTIEMIFVEALQNEYGEHVDKGEGRDYFKEFIRDVEDYGLNNLNPTQWAFVKESYDKGYGNTLEVYLNMKNPLDVEVGDVFDENLYVNTVQRAKEEGHDGVIFRDVIDAVVAFDAWDSPSGDVYIAFKPEQIKSVYNKGTFNANDPRMYYQLKGKNQPTFVGKLDTFTFFDGQELNVSKWKKTVETSINTPAEVQAALLNIDFITRVKKNQSTLLEAADYIGENGIAAAERLVFSKSEDNEVTFVISMILQEIYTNQGNLDKVVDLVIATSEKASNHGRALQALTMYNRLTPQGAFQMATRIIEGTLTPKDIIDVNNTSKDLNKKLGEVNEKAADDVEIDEKMKEIKELTPQEMLARRIANTLSENHSSKSPLQKMIDTLFAVAKESPLPNSRVVSDPLSFVVEAIENRAEYRDVWEKAKAIVAEQFKDDPNAMADLEAYFDKAINRTFPDSKLKKAIGNELAAMNVKIRDIVKQHYSANSKLRTSLVEKLVAESGLTEDEAIILEQHIRRQMKDMTKQAKESILNTMFKEKKTVERKSISERIIELSNLGAMNNNNFKGMVAAKLGLPALTEEAIATLDAQARDIQKYEDGSREQVIAIARMLDTIAAYIPANKAQKIALFQTMMQLLNPKTVGRNLVGNGGFATLEYISDNVGVPIDQFIKLITKIQTKKFNPLGKLVIQKDAYVEGFKLGLEDALLGIDTSGVSTQFDLPKAKVFRKGPLSALETTLNIALRATDRAAYNAAFQDALQEQLLISGLSEPTSEMIEIANALGQYRTFQDTNALSDAFVKTKQALNTFSSFFTGTKDFGLGDFVLKYPKTPANILARGLDYSPIGLIITAVQLYGDVSGNSYLKQKIAVDGISRALVGTALIGIGAKLFELGVLTGSRDKEEDDDVYSMKLDAGFKNFSVNVTALKRLIMSGFDPKEGGLRSGDTLATYDWFQPASIGIAIGADIAANSGSATSLSTKIILAMEAGSTTLAEQPLLTGIAKLFQGENVIEGFSEIAKGIPASFIPTFLSQIKMFVDDTRYSTYDPANWFGTGMNMIYNKIPGVASKKLAPAVGPFGDISNYYADDISLPSRIFNTFLNPAIVSKYETTPEMDLVFDLMKETGDVTQFPRYIGYKFTIKKGDRKEQVTLNPKQYSEIKQFAGTKIKEAYQNEIRNGIMRLDDEDQVDILYDILGDIGKEVRDKVQKMFE